MQLDEWDPFSVDDESGPVFDMAAAKAAAAAAGQQVAVAAVLDEEDWASWGSPKRGSANAGV